MILGTTKKMMNNLKSGYSNFVAIDVKSFWDWHAHVFIYNRRKCIIAINNATRYCIVLYGLKVEHFKNFDQIFLKSIRETFIAEGFNEAKVDKYIKSCVGIVCTKTYNRSIIGSLNEFLNIALYRISECDLTKMNLVDLNKFIGRLVSCKMDLVYPKDMLTREVEKCKSRTSSSVEFTYCKLILIQPGSQIRTYF